MTTCERGVSSDLASAISQRQRGRESSASADDLRTHTLQEAVLRSALFLKCGPGLGSKPQACEDPCHEGRNSDQKPSHERRGRYRSQRFRPATSQLAPQELKHPMICLATADARVPLSPDIGDAASDQAPQARRDAREQLRHDNGSFGSDARDARARRAGPNRLSRLNRNRLKPIEPEPA